MNALTLAGGSAATMTSREISGLVEQRHDNVKRTIETLGAKGVITLPQIEEVPNDGPGPKVIGVYSLDKRSSLIVVAQLCPEFTARIVDRWQELEAGAPPALNLRQPAQMLAVAMQLAEIVQEQQAKLTAQEPKVKFAEAVGASADLQSVAGVAKALGTGARRLFAFMRDNGILMVNNLPFQHHLDAGRFKVVEKPWKDNDGNDRLRLQTMVTGKGITFLQQRLKKNLEVMHAQPH